VTRSFPLPKAPPTGERLRGMVTGHRFASTMETGDGKGLGDGLGAVVGSGGAVVGLTMGGDDPGVRGGIEEEQAASVNATTKEEARRTCVRVATPIGQGLRLREDRTGRIELSPLTTSSSRRFHHIAADQPLP